MPSPDHELCATHNVYGLNCDDFDQLRARASGNCEMCGIDERDTRHRRLHIDHSGPYRDPASVRGLLCSPCNTGLGLAETGRRPFTEAERRFLNGVHASPTARSTTPRATPSADPSPEIERIRARLRGFAADRARAAELETEAVIAALLSGLIPTQVVRDVGRSREYVRRIERQAERDGRLPPNPA